MRVAIIVLGALFCSAATAAPEPWMKKENPETLHSAVRVTQSCAVDQEGVRKIVDGVLIRSRLKTGNYETGTETFGLFVKVDCLKEKESMFVVRVYFIRFFPELRRTMAEVDSYGFFGTGPLDFILGSVGKVVEEAVTDYLQANFDLTPE